MPEDFTDDEIRDMMPTVREIQATPICIRHRVRLPCPDCDQLRDERLDLERDE